MQASQSVRSVLKSRLHDLLGFRRLLRECKYSAVPPIVAPRADHASAFVANAGVDRGPNVARVTQFGADFAPPGTVTVVLAGDLAKEFRLLPPEALAPQVAQP